MEKNADFLLQFFAYEHLSPVLQQISKPFGECAKIVADKQASKDDKYNALDRLNEETNLPTNMQSNDCFSKIYQALISIKGSKPIHNYDIVRLILEAKDCAVRAFIAK